MISKNEYKLIPLQIAKIRHQEVTHYHIPDYLSPEYQHELSIRDNVFVKSVITESLRAQISSWAYSIVDHFEMDRGTATTSMLLFDKFVSCKMADSKVAQLVGLTCLYISIKLNEQNWRHKVPSLLQEIVKYCKNHFDEEHIVRMEAYILRTLDYHLHPPSPQNTIHLLIRLLPKCPLPKILFRIGDHANFLTELSTCDYSFVTHQSSTIALASLLVVLNAENSRLPYKYTESFLEVITSLTNFDLESEELKECLTKLTELYQSCQPDELDEQDEFYETREGILRDEMLSPISVTGVDVDHIH